MKKAGLIAISPLLAASTKSAIVSVEDFVVSSFTEVSGSFFSVLVELLPSMLMIFGATVLIGLGIYVFGLVSCWW